MKPLFKNVNFFLKLISAARETGIMTSSCCRAVQLPLKALFQCFVFTVDLLFPVKCILKVDVLTCSVPRRSCASVYVFSCFHFMFEPYMSTHYRFPKLRPRLLASHLLLRSNLLTKSSFLFRSVFRQDLLVPP